MKLNTKKIIAREFLILTIVLASGIITFFLTFPYNYYQESNEKTIFSEIATKSKQLDLLYSSAKKKIRMDEEVIEDLYNRAKSNGYNKSRNEFLALVHSDNEVFYDMYSYVKSQGYRKDENAFAILIGRISPPQNLNSLYNTLTEGGYYTKSFEEFKIKWLDENYRSKVYNVMTRDKIYTKDKDAFEQEYQSTETITFEIKVLVKDLDKLRSNREIFSERIISKEEQYSISIWVTAISFVILILLRFIYYGISWSISTLRSE
jgi:hypothetical protein